MMMGFCISGFIITEDSLIYIRKQEHFTKYVKERHHHVWTTVSVKLLPLRITTTTKGHQKLYLDH